LEPKNGCIPLLDEARNSDEKLAERLDLHRTYVADIERGARNLSLINIEKVAKGLNVSIADLFGKYNI